MGGWQPFDGNWEKLPSYYEYRIKPEPKPDHIRFTLACLQCADTFSNRPFNTDNLKLTFDGETLQLKSAEIL